ncbi:hypothetical protein TIFTF001_032047 [Ficus carica]|uniref:Uncharacterized protein n=1 Tax=Ficus carica TaxID=3494 RepID=A0AA88J7B1_FICCA|nr:hypothetical protein TIFTF001_032047 [Ficus carica]
MLTWKWTLPIIQLTQRKTRKNPPVIIVASDDEEENVEEQEEDPEEILFDDNEWDVDFEVFFDVTTE